MEQKKVFRIGKFNIIDVIAVALILAVALYAAVRVLNRGGTIEVPTMEITYVVRVQNVAAELYENSKENLPSPLMASGARLNGRIESVEATPWLELGPDGQWHEKTDYIMKSETVEFQNGTVIDVDWGE